MRADNCKPRFLGPAFGYDEEGAGHRGPQVLSPEDQEKSLVSEAGIRVIGQLEGELRALLSALETPLATRKWIRYKKTVIGKYAHPICLG